MDEDNLFAPPPAPAIREPTTNDDGDLFNTPPPQLPEQPLQTPEKHHRVLDLVDGTDLSSSADTDLFADCTDDIDLRGGGVENGTGGLEKSGGILQLDTEPPPNADIDLSDGNHPSNGLGGTGDNLSDSSTTALRGGDTPPIVAQMQDPPTLTTIDLSDPFGTTAIPPQAASAPPLAPSVVTPSAPPVAVLAPTPVASSSAPPAAAAATVLRKKRDLDDDQETEPLMVESQLDVSVTDYERRGDGMSAYVAYKVITKVPQDGIQGYNKKDYEVWRRFSDFLGLYDRLSVKHTHLGVIVPPPPEKSVLGMTKAKMSKTTEEDQSQSEFLERRRAALERFLRRVSLHPKLLIDCDFRDFLTMETELPRASQTSALSGNNMKKMFSKLGDSFSKITYRMDESDRWFEEKQAEIEELDESLKKLHHSIDLLLHFRRELAGSTEVFCKSMSMLAACEENTALSRAFSQLAETEEKVGLVQQDQAEKDFYILSEMLHDYVSLLMSVKEVFYERVKTWQRWQDNQRDLNKKREIKTRFELAGRSDKLPASKAEVLDAEQKVEEAEEAFERISKTIRREMRRFSTQRVKDFKATLLQYLESLTLTQQQLIKYWEAFLPEAKAIIT